MTTPTPRLTPVVAFTALARRWRTPARTFLYASAAAAAYTLIVNPTYEGVVTFVADAGTPRLSGSLSALANLAGAGLSLPALGSAPPDFYASIATSVKVFDSVLSTRFSTPDSSDGQTVSLLDRLAIDGDTPNERLYRGRRYLEDRIAASVSKRTGIVTVSVRLPESQLAADVANRIVALVNQFALQQLQLRSGAERRFSEGRLAQAESELRRAEDVHIRFLQTNRSIAGSPLLLAEVARLDRRVQVRQEVFLTITREYEQARVAEVRDTPVITVVDSAIPPFRRVSPRRSMLVILAGALGAILGSGLVLMLEFRDRLAASSHEEYEAVRNAFRGVGTEILAALTLRRPPGDTDRS